MDTYHAEAWLSTLDVLRSASQVGEQRYIPNAPFPPNVNTRMKAGDKYLSRRRASERVGLRRPNPKKTTKTEALEDTKTDYDDHCKDYSQVRIEAHLKDG